MNIFNIIQQQESASVSPNMLFMMPDKKTCYVHGGVRFLFYRPKVSTVDRYLSAANIRHDDFAVLGKVYISGCKMMLLFMDLAYYGVLADGTVLALGNKIAHLSMHGRKVYSYCSSGSDT